jgi:lysozyme
MNRQIITETLIQAEGLKLRPYRCTGGALTIGVGRNLDAKGITEAEARFMLANDIEEVWRAVVTNLPWVTKLTDTRQRVICEMGFQLGIGGLLSFKNTLAAVQAGRYADAAAGMLQSRWASQTPRRVQRLAAMMRQG